MKIPSNNRWTQTNEGDIFGVLQETHNITFDRSGKLKLSKKPFARYSSSDDADYGYTLSIVYFNGQYYVLTDDNIFKLDFGTTTVSEVTGGTPALNSDMQMAYNRAYFTENSNISYISTGGGVTSSVYALTADVHHPMTLFDSFTTYKLAVGDGNLVHLLDNASTANDSGTDLTLPEQYQVTTLAYRNGYLYVGTKHLNGGEAKVFIWNGETGNADFEVPVAASTVYSIIPYKTSVACITNQGQLFAIIGNTPQQLAQLPVYDDPDAIWDDGTNVSYIGKVMHRGMVAVGDLIYMNVNGEVDQGYVPQMKHGLWVYDPQVGLYHRSSHTLDKAVVEAATGLSSNTLTLSTHNLKTGDAIMFRNIGSLTGVQANTKYFVSVESATTIKLAISRKALQAGNYVTIGGSVTSSSIAYVPNTDWSGGHGASQFQGAVAAINPEEPVSTGWESQIIWGARVDNFAGSAFYGLYAFADAWNIGRFTTQRIYPQEISQTWERVYAFVDGIDLDNEKILIKYKAGNTHGYPTNVFQGTWGSTTTITSVTATQDEDQWTDLEVGDELTIVDGTGRGYTTHITSIDSSSPPTYTITVDESIGTNTNTVYFYADKFKKIKVHGNERKNKNYIEQVLTNVKSPWIQIKVELRGFQPEVSHLELISKPDNRAV